MRRSVSYRALGIYAALLFIIIMGTVLVSYIGGTQQLRRETVQSNLNMLNQIVIRVENALDTVDRTAIQFLQNNDTSYYFASPYTKNSEYLLKVRAVQNQLIATKDATPAIHSFHLLNLKTGMVLSNLGHAPKDSVSEWSMLAPFADSTAYYNWTAREARLSGDAAAHLLTLVRYYPIAERPQNRTGVFAVHMEESVISSMFNDLQFSGNGNVMIIDGQGDIIAHTDPQRIGQPANLQIVIPDNQKSGYKYDKKSKPAEWTFYASVPGTDWNVLYSVTQAQMSRIYFTIRNVLLLIAGGMLLLSLVSVFVVNHRLFLPMERFIRRTELLLGKLQGAPPGQSAQGSDGLGLLEGRLQHVIVRYTEAEQQMREARPVLKLRILLDIATGHRQKFELAHSYMNHVGIRLHTSHYIAMIIELDHPSLLENMTDINLYLYAVCNVGEELIDASNQELCGAAVQINELQALLLLSFPNGDAARNTRQAEQLARELQQWAQAYLSRSISIGMGSHQTEFAHINRSYQEARRNIHYNLVTGQNSIITNNSIALTQSANWIELFSLADQLQEVVWQANREQMGELLHRLFAEASRSQLSDKVALPFILQTIYRIGKRTNDPDIMYDLQHRHMRIEHDLIRCGTLQAMQRYVEPIMLTFIETLRSKRTAKHKDAELVASVAAHISGHYDNSELSLSLLADLHGISPNHLSKIFKAETGINFVDYVIAVRMKAAQDLLLHGKDTVHHIAGKVGYVNVTSFMRSFKKHSGMTPSAYRQSH